MGYRITAKNCFHCYFVCLHGAAGPAVQQLQQAAVGGRRAQAAGARAPPLLGPLVALPPARHQRLQAQHDVPAPPTIARRHASPLSTTSSEPPAVATRRSSSSKSLRKFYASCRKSVLYRRRCGGVTLQSRVQRASSDRIRKWSGGSEGAVPALTGRLWGPLNRRGHFGYQIAVYRGRRKLIYECQCYVGARGRAGGRRGGVACKCVAGGPHAATAAAASTHPRPAG
ncbi:hypothetical protein EVAR_58741_1 [Eumeta japonica]|uniref:Uncharacterized protein n=1 Tax=Eumeta variegata TaxID=151549 RepID=A0A4C1YVY2_EUMVA|nr:hypothetical protein EVAR_58741_1 [Eumeta japonica]